MNGINLDLTISKRINKYYICLKLFLVSTCMLLQIGCSVTFDPLVHEPFLKTGTANIEGKVEYRVGCRDKLSELECNDVNILPATKYALKWYKEVWLSKREEFKSPFKGLEPGHNKEMEKNLSPYVRTISVAPDGKFMAQGLPAGEYIVYAIAKVKAEKLYCGMYVGDTACGKNLIVKGSACDYKDVSATYRLSGRFSATSGQTSSVIVSNKQP